MVRKNYLVESLSKEEDAYIKKIIISARKKYIRDNYKYLNNNMINIDDCSHIEDESLLQALLSSSEELVVSAVDFEKVMNNKKLYDCIKALSLNEKMVLFYLFYEDKSIKEIVKIMGISKSTIMRTKKKTLNKIKLFLLKEE